MGFSIATGFLGVVGNKGAVAVGMKIMNTSICFLVSHLAAHQHQTIQRNLMVQDIVNRLKIGDAVSYLTHHYDAIIWFGKENAHFIAFPNFHI
jgi:phosphatidylinositol-bisphosphatase